MPYRADPDEGPTDADLARFADASGYCPECGREVRDDADLCPGCGGWITGEVRTEPPITRAMRGRWRVIVVVAVLIGFSAVLLGIRLI